MIDYLPLLSDRHTPATEDDLRSLETLVGALVPSDYAAFLRQTNGGRFVKGLVLIPPPVGNTILNELFAVNAATYDIAEDYTQLRAMDRIPVRTLPIADDPAGNLFLLSVEDGSYGQVFFWDHENEPPDGGAEVADFPNLTRLADSFEAFVHSLRADSS